MGKASYSVRSVKLSICEEMFETLQSTPSDMRSILNEIDRTAAANGNF